VPRRPEKHHAPNTGAAAPSAARRTWCRFG
jgi:hypothetical protein